MAVQQNTPLFVYDMNGNLARITAHVIPANRAPTTSDFADIGTLWIDTTTDTAYCICSITAGAAIWTTSPASGSGSFTSVTVNPGDVTVTAGDVTITAGDLDVTVGNTSLGGNLTVAGTTSLNGDIDFSSTALIDFTSSLNAAPSILLHADGGTSEQILLHSDQGTGVSSILLDSDVGGITLISGLASADAINLTAGAGGLDLDAALQINIASSQNAASAIVINASAGGIDITNTGTSGEDIDIASSGASVNVSSSENAAGAITLTTNGGTSETMVLTNSQGTGATSIALTSTAGGITATAGLASDDAVNVVASAGGVDVDAALQINIDSSEEAADAIVIAASGTAGGIDCDSGTGGTAIDSTGAISIDGAAASNFSVSGAGIDLTFDSAAGRVVIDGGEAAVNAITLDASDTAGGIDANAGTGGITVDTTGAISIDAAAASNMSVSGAGIDLSIESAAGRVVIDGGEAAADAILIDASDTAGGVTVSAGTGGIALSAAGAVSMVPVAASVAGVSTTANGRVFKATFTGQTTAAAGTQAYTITNSASGAGDAVLLTLVNRGSNDAQITVNRVNTETAGTIVVNTTNEGAAALNGDVIISGWVLD